MTTIQRLNILWVTGVQGDRSNLADLDRLYDIVKQQKGQLDILFANARWKKVTKYMNETWINLSGLINTIGKVLMEIYLNETEKGDQAYDC
jgi:NAD(P)-dependent dehydrogenase (short-subunit alcohol dehydrogenase family)